MKHRTLGIAVGLALANLLLGARPVLAQTGDAAFDAAFAERLALIGDDAVAGARGDMALVHQGAVTLKLATQYNPKEIRFARSLVDAYLKLGDVDHALETLSIVRSLDPKDQVAMIQFVDLQANKMETADQKMAYLQNVVAANAVLPEVRSHAAAALTDTYIERSQDAQALAMLDKALELNPQNLEALAMKTRLAERSGVEMDLVKAHVAQLMASPLDTDHLRAVAHDATNAGAYDESHTLYSIIYGVLGMRQQSPAIDDIIDLVGVELMRGKPDEITGLLDQATNAFKDDGRLFSLRMLVDQYSGKTLADQADKIAAARGVHLASLAGVSQLLNDPSRKEMPATNPAVPMPNVAADAEKLVKDDASNLRAAYAVALAEQLWFDLYFRAAPVDDASINALATLLGETDPLVVRFQGWKLLSAGQFDEAKVKFDAIAARDGYAQLGLVAIALQQKDADTAKRLLTDLLKARPSGTVLAYAALAAKQQNVTVAPTTDEDAIAKILTSARIAVTDLASNPRNSYLLTATPVSVSFGYDEPLLARVSIQNTGRQPITLGPGALVQPQLTVDLQTRGENRTRLPAQYVGEIAGAIRLKPRESVTQIVRLDRGVVNQFFATYPTPLITANASISTNGIPTQGGTVVMAGGQQTTVGSAIERRSSPLHVEGFRTKLMVQISKGSSVERLSAMQLAASVVPMLSGDAATADAKAVGGQLSQAIDAQLANESVAEVRAWVKFQLARVQSLQGEQLRRAKELVAEESPIAKLAGLLLARGFPETSRQEVARLVLDGQPTGWLAEFAQAIFDQKDLPSPTTKPTDTTMPASN